MTTPLPFLIRMLLFLVAVSGLAFVLRHDLIRVFLNTPILNSVIFGVMLLGIVFVLRQVISLWPEVAWLRRLHHRKEGVAPPDAGSVNLLAPMAAMLGENSDRLRLSPMATRAVLDGVATRLDEGRELTRYMIGLLIFLGLLGTFWGLLETIGAVADAIVGLQATSGDSTQMFARLKASIEGPLKGMSTAFGASLFGLSGSLVLGFLELQTSQASGRFLNDLEEWLSGATRISSGTLQIDGDQAVPAYVEALLERTADGLDELGRILRRNEESREAAAHANTLLVERLSGLAETMRSQQHLLARLGENSIELRAALSRFTDRPADSDNDGELLRVHLRNMEGYLSRLVEETGRNRTALADDLRGEFKLLARTIASSRGGS
jgi:hypothetical protein